MLIYKQSINSIVKLKKVFLVLFCSSLFLFILLETAIFFQLSMNNVSAMIESNTKKSIIIKFQQDNKYQINNNFFSKEEILDISNYYFIKKSDYYIKSSAEYNVSFNKTALRNNSIEILGVRNDELLLEYFPQISLNAGLFFGENEIIDNKNKIIIPQSFSNKNKVLTGDKILFYFENEFSNIESEKKAEKYEIIGIYNDEALKIAENSDTNEFPIIFLNDSIESLFDISFLYKNNQLEYQPIYFFDSFSDIADFKKIFEKIIPSNFYMFVNGEEYNTLYIMFNSAKTMLSLVIFFIYPFSTLIFLLIVILIIKYREKEFKIYYSLGERQRKIVFLVFTEVGIIISFSFLFSLLISYNLGQNIMSNILIEAFWKSTTEMNTVDNKFNEMFFSANFRGEIFFEFISRSSIFILSLIGISSVIILQYIKKIRLQYYDIKKE